MSYLPDIPPQIRSSALHCPLRGITRLSTPTTHRCPVAKKSKSRAVLEGHRAFCFLGEAAASVDATSLKHPADPKKCSQRLQHVPATATAQPQNLLENLNAEEPASPKPSIPNPELCYTRLIAGSVPLSK